MNVTCNFKWVLSSQKLKSLENGKRLILEKFICKSKNGEWKLKILQQTDKSGSFGLTVERETNVNTKGLKSVIYITINLYARKPKQHIFRKRFVETLYQKNSVKLDLGSHIKKMVKKGTASIISGSIVIKETREVKNLETIFEDLTAEAVEELRSDLSKFCCHHLFSDVILACRTEKFPAHKLILAARCPYFAEFFQNSEKSQIDITNLKPDVLKAMLFFIYSAKIEQLTQELACDLLIASVAYKLNGLRVICVNYLKSILSVENIFPIYVLAIAIDEELKIHALKYISSNFSSIENTNEWQNFLKETPTVAIQILSGIVKSVD